MFKFTTWGSKNFQSENPKTENHYSENVQAKMYQLQIQSLTETVEL